MLYCEVALNSFSMQSAIIIATGHDVVRNLYHHHMASTSASFHKLGLDVCETLQRARITDQIRLGHAHWNRRCPLLLRDLESHLLSGIWQSLMH